MNKEIPQKFYYNNRIYNYVKQCNDDLFLYEESRCKYKATFSLYQLGLLESPKLNLRAHRNQIW